MRKVVLLSIILLMFMLQSTAALEDQSFQQLRQLMIDGCSLGMETDIRVKGDGNISIFRRGASGEFSFKKSQLPAVVSQIEKDAEKRNVASDTRSCMERFMNRLFDAVLTSGSSIEYNTRAPRPENDDLQIALDAARTLEWQPTREQRVIEIAETAMCRHDFGVAEQAISAIVWEPARQRKQEQLVDFLVCARQFDDALDVAKAIAWAPTREQKIKKISEYASRAIGCPTDGYPYSVCK